MLEVRAAPLSVDEVLAAVADEAAGGTSLFVGTVREHDGGRQVSTLSYSAHPQATAALHQVAEKVRANYAVVALAAVHRVGDLSVGDIAVVTAVATHHRGTAFAACQELIDEVKHAVPIWKHQLFADGTEEWVGLT